MGSISASMTGENDARAVGAVTASLPEPEAPHSTRERGLRIQITATLIGATLLVCSLVAHLLWKTSFHSAAPAATAVLLLGLPLAAAAPTFHALFRDGRRHPIPK